MKRLAWLVLLSGCATAPVETRSVSSPEPFEARADPAAAAFSDWRIEPVAAAFAATLPAPILADGGESSSYVTFKGGALYPSENDLDTGYILNGAYGRYFTRLFAIEFEGGYATADPDASSVDNVRQKRATAILRSKIPRIGSFRSSASMFLRPAGVP